MAELLTVGPESEQHWKKELPPDLPIRIGRAPKSGWSVPWDRKISREHATITFQDGKLVVQTLETARNPTLYCGKSSASFDLTPGQQFQIGDTTFKLVEIAVPEEEFISQTAELEKVLVEHAFGREQLAAVKFDNNEDRLEVLCQLPPLISQSTSDKDFASRIVDVLLQTIPRCNAAAVVQFHRGIGEEFDEPSVMSWSSREEMGRFCPSRRLMQTAIRRNQSIAHFWTGGDENASQYTFNGSLDWAFCIPIPGEACHGWCLYVSGNVQVGQGMAKLVSEDDLKPDMRFAKVMAEFISAVRQVRMLQQQQTEMSHFFSPAVVETIRDSEYETILMPREGDISVLFCDVREFSSKVAQAANDLQSLLFRVSEALGVMTRCIQKHEGVIADFQGDAALAFWGWPSPLDQGPLLACRTALAIYREFAAGRADPKSPLYGFHVGIGVGCGNAIAGKIGSKEQIKVGVFGPIVNLTARLESMTKQLGVTVLLDERTASFAADNLPASEGRLRRLARVRPVGIRTPVVVTQLLLPEAEDGLITDTHIERHEAALAAVTDGNWTFARELLANVAAGDTAAQFLLDFLAENDFDPPCDWDGAITLNRK